MNQPNQLNLENTMGTLLKFIGLIFMMFILFAIPFGDYIVAGIIIYALWIMVK